MLSNLDFKKQGYQNQTVGTHEVSTSKDPALPTGVEVRCDASKKLRLLQIGMRGLWKPVKQAIIDHAEMWTLGISQGVSRAMAATAGRQRVLDGLSIAADIRQDIRRWESLDHRVTEGTCSPFGRKAADISAKWRIAANDDCRAVCIYCAEIKSPRDFSSGSQCNDCRKIKTDRDQHEIDSRLLQDELDRRKQAA